MSWLCLWLLFVVWSVVVVVVVARARRKLAAVFAPIINQPPPTPTPTPRQNKQQPQKNNPPPKKNSFDLTWGPLEYHRRSLDNLQEAMRRTRKLCAIVVDTLGRELMVRRPFRIDPDGWPNQVGQEISVAAGSRLTLTTRDVEAGPGILPVTYPKFAAMMEPGDDVYIGRYLVSGADRASLYLQVVEVVGGTDVVCVAKNEALLDGLLTVFHVERSSDELLNAQNDLPLLSEYDKECLAALSAEYEIDFVSLSYTRNVNDVMEARDFLDSIGLNATRVFAKVESRQALLAFRGILAEADGIIISRGNLGLDCVPEKMALIQKTLVQSCNLIGKPCVITRVVDTMAVTPRPTRAEATDVANAGEGFLLLCFLWVAFVVCCVRCVCGFPAQRPPNTLSHPTTTKNNNKKIPKKCSTASTASYWARRRCAASTPSTACAPW